MGATRDAGFWQWIGEAVAALGSRHPFGMRLLEARPERGELEFGFDSRREHADISGRIRNGYLCAMLDDALATTLSAACGPGQSASALDMRVQYVHPAVAGAFVGRARLVSCLADAATVEGELYQQGSLVARAVATGVLRDRPA